MVTSPDGQGIILVGCSESNEAIYELKNNETGNLEWKLMTQKLQHPRSVTVAMLIPDELTNCS